MRKYVPRRANKTRWLAGAPENVLDVFDSKGPGERYTVFLGALDAYHLDRAGNIKAGTGEYGKTYLQYFGADSHPRHPQGIGMWGEMGAYEVAQYRYRKKHQRIKWADLPDTVKACVLDAIKPEATP